MILTSMFSLNWQDALKGLIVAVITTILSSLYPIIESGTMPTPAQWKMIGMIGLGAGLSYVIKNFFTPAPKTVTIDSSKTTVIDKATDTAVVDHVKVEATVVTTDTPAESPKTGG